MVGKRLSARVKKEKPPNSPPKRLKKCSSAKISSNRTKGCNKVKVESFENTIGNGGEFEMKENEVNRCDSEVLSHTPTPHTYDNLPTKNAVEQVVGIQDIQCFSDEKQEKTYEELQNFRFESSGSAPTPEYVYSGESDNESCGEGTSSGSKKVFLFNREDTPITVQNTPLAHSRSYKSSSFRSEAFHFKPPKLYSKLSQQNEMLEDSIAKQAANYTDVIGSVHRKEKSAYNTPEPSYIKRVKLSNSEEPTDSSSQLVSDESHSSQKETSNGMWDPIGFSSTNFYHKNSGILLSKSECEENFKKTTKNNRETDFYPFLQIAAAYHNKDAAIEKLALGQAFNTAMNNKLLAKINQLTKKLEAVDDDKNEYVKGVGFDLKGAREGNIRIVLPSRRSFDPSDIITPSDASKWTSSRFYSDCRKLFKLIYKKVAQYDAFFAGYSAMDVSNTGYIAVGSDFYEGLTKYAIIGFGQQYDDLNIQKSIICLAREVLVNLIDSFRKEFKKTMITTPADIANDLRKQLERYKQQDVPITPINFNDPNPVNGSFESLQLHPSYKHSI